LTYTFGVLVRLDRIRIKFEGQGYMWKFTIT